MRQKRKRSGHTRRETEIEKEKEKNRLSKQVLTEHMKNANLSYE